MNRLVRARMCVLDLGHFNYMLSHDCTVIYCSYVCRVHLRPIKEVKKKDIANKWYHVYIHKNEKGTIRKSNRNAIKLCLRVDVMLTCKIQ